ncbi:MAG: hypothetical protein JWM57_1322, partial [Phycisphaerales bacterium]|nr:hypothetical protein [Phycisphaerales bacterium]
DSITFGYGLGSPSERYSSILCDRYGWTEDNRAVNSTVISDNAEASVLTTTIGASDRCFWLAGYNDMAQSGTNAAALADNRAIVRSLLARMAIPTALVMLAEGGAFTYTGAWSTIGSLGGFRYSTTAGNTVTFTAAGSAIIIGFLRGPGGGNASVAIDGGSPTTVSCLRTATPIGVDANAAVPTAAVFSGLANGSHTVTVTVSSGSVFFHWAAGIATPPGPRVFIGGCLSMSQAEYANTAAGSDLACEVHTQMFIEVATELRAAGLDVRHRLIKIGTSGQLQADIIHPNASGHATTAAQFYEGISPTEIASATVAELYAQKLAVRHVAFGNGPDPRPAIPVF